MGTNLARVGRQAQNPVCGTKSAPNGPIHARIRAALGLATAMTNPYLNPIGRDLRPVPPSPAALPPYNAAAWRGGGSGRASQ